MIINQLSQRSSLNPHLRMLSLLRCLVLCCQALALFYYSYIENIGLPTSALSICLSLFGVVTVFGWLRAIRAQPVTRIEFLAHLGLEIIVLTLVFYFAGGASNPFVSYYLVPVCIAAAVLPAIYVFSTAAAAILAYSLLIFYYVPNEALMPHGGHGGNLHLLGMWVNFLVSAVLISYFIVRMAATIAIQRDQIGQQREKQFEDDRLISIATLAASTAHELGTPLNSIHLLSKELSETGANPRQQNLAQQLYEQANICKKTLNKLVDTANQNIQKTPQQAAAKEFFRDLFDRWQLIHPGVAMAADFSALSPGCLINLRPTLEPLMFNLLNNAVQANSAKIEIAVTSDSMLRLRIRDYGQGFSKEISDRLGKPFNTDREDGMGIGLYLAKNSIEQLGGSLEFVDWEQGTETRVSLPNSDAVET